MYLLILSSSFWTTHCNLPFLTHSITQPFSISVRPRSAFAFGLARFLSSFLLHRHRSPSYTALQKKRKTCLEINARPRCCLSPSSERPQSTPSSSFSPSSSSFLSLSLALLLQLHRHDGPPALEHVARLQDLGHALFDADAVRNGRKEKEKRVSGVRGSIQKINKARIHHVHALSQPLSLPLPPSLPSLPHLPMNKTAIRAPQILKHHLAIPPHLHPSMHRRNFRVLR